MAERDVQAAIFQWLIMHNHLAIRINSGAMVQTGQQNNGRIRRLVRFATWQVVGRALNWAGVSDILACICGRFVAIEVKDIGKKANISDHQTAFLAAVRQCGGLAIVADCIEDVERAISEGDHYGNRTTSLCGRDQANR